ncbi:MAG: hypothetical protein J5726_04700 [Treponema sp.]|nr:hypothetical protein [Treponema sp.]
MKKIFTILSVFLGLGFVICIVTGMFMPVPAEVPARSNFLYKFCIGLEYFARFLPAMAISGFVISFSVYFGHNSEGSTQRFSPAMGDRYKAVMIAALSCTFLVTLSNETFSLWSQKKRTQLVNKTKIIKEYIDVGNLLLDNGLNERALIYANAALKLNPNSNEARDLKSRADMEINRIYTSELRFDLTKAEPLEIADNSLIMDTEKISDSYKCLLQSRSAYDNEQWFNAHYYAELGIKLSDPKNPNMDELRDLSAKAWNNITQLHKSVSGVEYDIYDLKYKGYLALVNKNDLEAYYIFRGLLETYPETARDSDVTFYLEVATDRIEQEYFFVDETLELSSFESANDVYFAYTHKNGAKEIVYFKGVTSVQSTGQSIQYLRDLTIVSLDAYGKFIRKLSVPYAKLMPVSVKNLTAQTKDLLLIDEKTDFVPYILLKSVGRDDESIQFGPTYTYADGSVETTPEYLIFPIKYSDFLMLETSPANPKTGSLLHLIRFAKDAASYGFARELYAQTLLNRLLFPLFMLVLFIILAGFAWDNRVGANQMFRFSWVFSFPFIIVLSYFAYNFIFILFKLINFVILSFVNGMGAVFAAAGIYIAILLLVSISFMARNTSE